MHSVQPEFVDLMVASPSAFYWLQKRWGHAKCLNLVFGTLDLPWLMTHEASNLSNLLVLCVQLQPAEECSTSSAVFVMWMLACASALRLLVINSVESLVLPPLSHLPCCCCCPCDIRNLKLAVKLRRLRGAGDSFQDSQLQQTGGHVLCSLPDIDKVQAQICLHLPCVKMWHLQYHQHIESGSIRQLLLLNKNGICRLPKQPVLPQA